MIIEIGSSLKTFKTLKFRPGLNILLADRHRLSGDTDTRNGCGKSSAIQIVHFLLGSRKGKGSFLTHKAVSKAHFWGRFHIGGVEFRVQRSVSNHGEVLVEFRNGVPASLLSSTDMFNDKIALDVNDWNRWLGSLVFKLPLESEGTPAERKLEPTFRSMIGYFARRREAGGFLRPHLYSTDQREGAARIALSYLFGLQWKLSRSFELAKDERRKLTEERKKLAARLDDKANTVGKLLNLKTIAEADARVLRKQVENFQVAEHYDELVAEADAGLALLEGLAKEKARLTTSVRHIRVSLAEETPPNGDVVEKLYREAGINLPGSVAKRFEDVQIFHQSVIQNRRVHLAGELEHFENRLAEIAAETTSASLRRTEILNSLAGKGAFGDLADLAKRLGQKEELAARANTQYEEAREMQSGTTKLKADENRLLSRLQNDLAARASIIGEAVTAAREARTALYGDRWGTFEINATSSGPEFKLQIESGQSGGISSMEIFCFDYALAKGVASRFGGPGFLIHDSHLFDPVDSRQQATALELGSWLAAEIDGQYIAMMNSDEFEKLEFSDGFDAMAYVLPIILEDTEEGGLFGFRFG